MPGPWRWDAGGGFIVAADHKMVCEFGSPSKSGVRPANARLIAAAPELLTALLATWIIIESEPDFLDHIGHCTSKVTGKTLHETVRAAIAKATGEAA